MTKARKVAIILFCSIAVAIISHNYAIMEWLGGRFMIGVRDGTSQMLSFKKLLYDNFTAGNFFYSERFGLGGGTYSQLSYYYAVSIVFYITVAITWVLEKLQIIAHPDILYWGKAMLIISIVRMVAIIGATTYYFKTMRFATSYAFIGAVFYATAGMYFRHVMYWEFFADAMLWLPLLLIGVEKLIRNNNMTLFTLMVAVSLFDNFYFAYINFLLATIYIVAHWFITCSPNETKIITQIWKYLLGGVIGFAISAVSFIPAVYGYLNNSRPIYEDTIEGFKILDNFLLDGTIVIVPAIALMLLFMPQLYKNKRFRLYAVLLWLTMLMLMSPMVASVFNGFSAPQYRWQYFMLLLVGGMIAAAVPQLPKLSKRSLWFGVLATLIILVPMISLYWHCVNPSHVLDFAMHKYSLLFSITLPAVVVAVLFYAYKANRYTEMFLAFVLLGSTLYSANVYQIVKLDNAIKNRVTVDFLQGEKFAGPTTQQLVKQIQAADNDPHYRIDWMLPARNNTPIVQDFNGLSVYSSILNKHLLEFYWYDLQIDTGRETVSRYMTLGDRTNLYSMLGGKYYIAKDTKKAIPHGFEERFTEGNYIAYENTNMLPFVRTTKNIYAQKDLQKASIIAKEHAMLDGIILDSDKGKKIPPSENIMPKMQIETTDNATYENDILHIEGDERGGIDIVPEKRLSKKKDYYVSFYLKNRKGHGGYTLGVNHYRTSRKSNDSIYRTDVDNITVRVQGAKKIKLRLPPGEYKLADIAVYEEDYKTLRKAIKHSDDDADVERKGNKIAINLNNTKADTHVTIPVPFEKGWQAQVNGKNVEPLQANYAFIGLPIEAGKNKIELVYYPPYFKGTLALSVTALVLFLLTSTLIHRRKR